jgi:hypothetical protein
VDLEMWPSSRARKLTFCKHKIVFFDETIKSILLEIVDVAGSSQSSKEAEA